MEQETVTRRTALRTAACAASAAGIALVGAACAKEEVRIQTVSGETENLWLYNPAGVRADGQYVDKLLKTSMDAEGLTKPPLAAQSCARVELKSVEASTSAEIVTDLYYKRGWTDGLPIVPPDERRMIRMCKGTDLPRERAIATMPPLMGQATVEKIAANAVMAGCRAEYLPVVLAAVECVCDDAYDLVGVSTTTSPNASLVLVNGPAAEALNINGGGNCLGRGHRANAAIGRALHLCEQNIGGAWPQVSDFSSLGMPGDYSWMMAENASQSPWEPFSVEQGFDADTSLVTVMSGSGMHLIVDIDLSNEEYLDAIARYMALNNKHERHTLVVMPPYSAQDLAASGWDKPAMRKYITERFNSSVTPELQVAGDLPIYFVVAGGVGEKNYVIPLWHAPVSREIRFPVGADVHLTDETE